MKHAVERLSVFPFLSTCLPSSSSQAVSALTAANQPVQVTAKSRHFSSCYQGRAQGQTGDRPQTEQQVRTDGRTGGWVSGGQSVRSRGRRGIVSGTEETSGHTDGLHVEEDVYYIKLLNFILIILKINK